MQCFIVAPVGMMYTRHILQTKNSVLKTLSALLSDSGNLTDPTSATQFSHSVNHHLHILGLQKSDCTFVRVKFFLMKNTNFLRLRRSFFLIL